MKFLQVSINRPNSRNDLIGVIYGDFVVRQYLGRSRWLLRCKCGADIVIRSQGIRRGWARRECDHVPHAIRITCREREVIALVAEGLTNNQIAVHLIISPYTVKVHVTNLLRKFGVANRTQLAVAFIKG